MSASLAPSSFVPPSFNRAGEKTGLLLDCRAGVAGDMFSAALLHLVDELWTSEGAVASGEACRQVWKTTLDSLQLENVGVFVDAVQKRGIGAKQLRVEHDEHHPHRGLSDVLEILRRGTLTEGALNRATATFTALAEAEAAVHQTTVEQVHFHEVGAVDAIIDIASAAILLDALSPDVVIATKVRTGAGHVECAHGLMPVPAPATARLLRGIPTFAGDIEKELATPTGAAILRANVDRFEDAGDWTPWAEGYGAGQRETPHANVVRATFATERAAEADLSVAVDAETLVVMETHIDDMTGEDFGALTERLFEHGAVDVSAAAAVGKKGRPMTWVRVLARPAEKTPVLNALFAHSTTLGVRVRTEERLARVRDVVSIQTAWGPVTGKRVVDGDGERFFPEADDCAAIAQRANVSVAQVRHAAIAAFADHTR